MLLCTLLAIGRQLLKTGEAFGDSRIILPNANQRIKGLEEKIQKEGKKFYVELDIYNLKDQQKQITRVKKVFGDYDTNYHSYHNHYKANTPPGRDICKNVISNS